MISQPRVSSWPMREESGKEDDRRQAVAHAEAFAIAVLTRNEKGSLRCAVHGDDLPSRVTRQQLGPRPCNISFNSSPLGLVVGSTPNGYRPSAALRTIAEVIGNSTVAIARRRVLQPSHNARSTIDSGRSPRIREVSLSPLSTLATCSSTHRARRPWT